MFAQERHDLIIKQVNQEGSVRVKDLSLLFEVTEDCIRKDLTILEKKGLLKKAYGGAVRVRENPHLYKSEERKNTPNNERVILANKALSLIENKETIFLDISLASVEFAQLLVPSQKEITVITNMIEVLNILSHCSHITLVFIGGQINKDGDGFCDSLSLSMIRLFKIDKAFIGVVGVDYEHGQLSTYHIDDGCMKKAILEQSRMSYAMCEERKLLEEGNYVFASLNDINGLIVSKDLSHTVNEALEEYSLLII